MSVTLVVTGAKCSRKLMFKISHTQKGATFLFKYLQLNIMYSIYLVYILYIILQ